MSQISDAKVDRAHSSSTHRYWRRAETPRPWWPWGMLPLLALIGLFLFGALVTAPNIQAEVREQVADRIDTAGINASLIRGDGQGISIRAVAPVSDETYLHALAKSTECDTWAGKLTCPTTVSVRLRSPQSSATDVANSGQIQPRAIATATESPAPAAVTNCDERFDEVLSQSTVRFRSGSAMVDRSNDALLQRLASIARTCPGELTIAGYTDSRGSAVTNRELSQARAQAVGDALAQLGIDGDRITAQGFGEENPIADNATPSGRAKNRRIVITMNEKN